MHKCFIQPEGKDCDAPCTKTVPLSQVGARAIVSMNAEAGTAKVERDPPLLVYADYEAITREVANPHHGARQVRGGRGHPHVLWPELQGGVL